MSLRKVCIAISCYNQEKYIGQCIEHLMAQQLEADVQVKILICDDASTDRTKFLIEDIINKTGLRENWQVEDHSNQQNMGMPKNTKRIVRLLMDSGTDYGCILEGDDYWISPFWLKKHMEPLDEDCSVSMSNNYLLLYNQETNVFAVRQYPEKVQKSKYILPEMQAEDNYTGNFSSSLYRISSLNELPETFLEQPYVDDWFMNLLMAAQGKIASIKEPVSVYRIHQESVWNGHKNVSEEGQEENTISQRIRFIHQHYPGKYIAELAAFSEQWAKIPMRGKIYYDLGTGYKEEQSLAVYMMFENKSHFTADVDLSILPKRIKSLRYDPEEGYACEIWEAQAFLDGNKIEMTAENGTEKNGRVIFDTKDPIFILQIPKKQMKRMEKFHIEGDIEFK